MFESEVKKESLGNGYTLSITGKRRKAPSFRAGI
jgi:hypothetical protein